MLISGRKRFVFIHLPRTAGFSVEAALNDWSDLNSIPIFNGHVTANLLSRLVLNWTSYFSFAFVRNPWDYWVSMYHHILTTGPTHPEWAHVASLRTFRCYMCDYVLERNTVSPYLNQIDYVTDYHGRVIVSYVGRYERLKQQFSHCCRQIGVQNVELPTLNHSKRGPVSYTHLTLPTNREV